ncbi:MAG: hypothetical protein Q8L27_01715 [archaeon]|nr:hypothetical protein [archaeon]
MVSFEITKTYSYPAFIGMIIDVREDLLIVLFFVFDEILQKKAEKWDDSCV